MKDLFKKITKPLFIFSLFILISCEKDLYEEKVKPQHNSQALLLRGKDAEKASELLKKRLSQGNHIISPSPYARVLNVTIGTISYDEVLKVIDEMGKENYSFKLERPESSDSKFYNVVLQQEEESTVIKIIEYAMNPEFAEQYKTDKNLMAFKGSIKFTPVYNDSPCPDPELIIQIGEVTIPSLGGGGGNNNNNDPGGSPVVTGNGGHGNGLSLLLTIINANNASGGSGNTTTTSTFDTVGNIRCDSGCHYDPVLRDCVSDEKVNKMTLRPDPVDGDLTVPPATTDPCTHLTEIGILPPYDKCSKTFLDGLSNLGNDSDAAWLYNHNSIYAELMNYLNGNPNCSEANVAAKEMLDRIKQDSLTFLSIKPLLIEKNIDDTQLDPCSKNILNNLKNLQQQDIAKIIAKLGNPKSTYRVKIIRDNTLPNDTYGSTDWSAPVGSPIIPYEYTIKLNSQYTQTATKLSITSTIIHELIHAYFLSLVDDNDVDDTSLNSFPILWDYYVNHFTGDGANIAEHNQMAAKYVNAIACALQEYQTGISVPDTQQPEQIYKDLAWGGLGDTPPFNALSNTEKLRIIAVNDAESLNINQISNGNNYSPISNPCN